MDFYDINQEIKETNSYCLYSTRGIYEIFSSNTLVSKDIIEPMRSQILHYFIHFIIDLSTNYTYFIFL